MSKKYKEESQKIIKNFLKGDMKKQRFTGKDAGDLNALYNSLTLYHSSINALSSDIDNRDESIGIDKNISNRFNKLINAITDDKVWYPEDIQYINRQIHSFSKVIHQKNQDQVLKNIESHNQIDQEFIVMVEGLIKQEMLGGKSNIRHSQDNLSSGLSESQKDYIVHFAGIETLLKKGILDQDNLSKGLSKVQKDYIDNQIDLADRIQSLYDDLKSMKGDHKVEVLKLAEYAFGNFTLEQFSDITSDLQSLQKNISSHSKGQHTPVSKDLTSIVDKIVSLTEAGNTKALLKYGIKNLSDKDRSDLELAHKEV